MGESAAWNYGSWQSFTGKSQVQEEFFQEEVSWGGVEGAGAGAGGGQGRVSRGGSHILAHRAAQELRGHADWTAGNMGEWSR